MNNTDNSTDKTLSLVLRFCRFVRIYCAEGIIMEDHYKITNNV